MNQRLYGFKVLAAVLAALILSGPATAGEQVPFKSQSSGVSMAVGFDPVKGIAYQHAEGTGTATQLGHFTVTGEIAVYVNTPTGIALGNWTFTAANGDQLFAVMVGDGKDALHGQGTFTFVGGTGRFQGATGSCQQIITFAVNPATVPVVAYTDVLEGTISSPGLQ